MVKGVKTYQFSRRFKKGYQGLPKEIQEAFDQRLPLLLKDLLHPSLRIKRIQGTKDRWEGSIAMKYRFTLELSGDNVIFRAVGTHDILVKEAKQTLPPTQSRQTRHPICCRMTKINDGESPGSFLLLGGNRAGHIAERTAQAPGAQSLPLRLFPELCRPAAIGVTFVARVLNPGILG